jgi:hypothetical protein
MCTLTTGVFFLAGYLKTRLQPPRCFEFWASFVKIKLGIGVLGHGNVLPKFKKLWEVIRVLGSIVRHIKGTRKHI